MSTWHIGLTRLTAIATFLALVRPHSGRAISKETQAHTQGPVQPYAFHLEVLRQIPHDGLPFTQGLEMSGDGQLLVETSGSYPPGTASFIRTIDPSSGRTVTSLKDGLDGRFIEGITRRPDGHWIASTYQDQAAVEYDDNLNMVGEHKYPHTGWGLALTPDGDSFLATNGSDIIMTLDKDFKLKDAKVVTCLGKRVTGMNELELVDNFAGIPGKTLLGNLYLSRLVLAVNPATGQCIGTFSLDGLGAATEGERAGFHAANGLAYNKTSQTLWATGKNWDQMYEVRVTQDPQGLALGELNQHLLTAQPNFMQRAALLELSSSGVELSSNGDIKPKAGANRVNILRQLPPN